MRRQILSLIAGIGILFSITLAWADGITLKAQTQNAIGTAIPATGFTTAGFHVCCGAFTGVVNFLASLDGTNFEALGCLPVTGNPYTDVRVTSASVRGLWRCDISATDRFLRADLTGYGGGTVTVTIATRVTK